MTYEMCIRILALSDRKPLFTICRLHYTDDYVKLTKAMFHESPIDVFEARIGVRFATKSQNANNCSLGELKPPPIYARAIIVTINVISV
jgi:hypothetical protein